MSPTRGLRRRAPRAAVAGCLLLALSAGAAAQDPPSIADLMSEAQAAFDRADVVGAMTLYRRAAERGHAPAQTRLAYLLDLAEDDVEALRWYGVAAEQDFAPALYGLASMLAAPNTPASDPPRALALMERAARQGHAAAIRTLANAYEHGELGVVRDYEQAVTWLRAGAQVGDASSLRRLARAYRRGELGLRRDVVEADELAARLRAAVPGGEQRQ